MAVVMLLFALGTGANAAILSVSKAEVLRDFPVPNPRQIVFVQTSTVWTAELSLLT